MRTFDELRSLPLSQCTYEEIEAFWREARKRIGDNPEGLAPQGGGEDEFLRLERTVAALPPGFAFADAVEHADPRAYSAAGTLSGDVEQVARLNLWFFRDLVDEQRMKLFALCGYPVDEITNHGAQSMVFRAIVAALRTQAPEDNRSPSERYIAAVHDMKYGVAPEDRFIADGEHLNCPACGGSGHVDDIQEFDKATPGPWFVRKRTAFGEVADCFIAAPDVQGLAYDAEIMGDDEYRDGVERKVADAELIVAAVNAYRAGEKA